MGMGYISLLPAKNETHVQPVYSIWFWSSADIRIAYFCMLQTVPIFISMGLG